jgi:tetratricopeptide (TPR) repeat protein
MIVDDDLFNLKLALSGSLGKSGNLGEAISYAMTATKMARELHVYRYLSSACYLAEFYEAAGEFEQSIAFFEEASDLAVELLSHNTNDNYAGLTLAICYAGRGRIYSKIGNLEYAFLFFQELYNATARLMKFEAPNEATFLEWTRLHAVSCQSLSDFYIKQQKGAEALPLASECYDLCMDRLDAYPDDPDTRMQVVIAAYGLGDAYRLSGNMDEALCYYRKTYEGASQLSSAFRDNYEFCTGLIISLEKLGNWYLTAGEVEAALIAYEQQYAIVQQLYHDDPGDLTKTTNLMSAAMHLGALYLKTREFDRSVLHLQEANDLGIGLIGKYPNIVGHKHNLAMVYANLFDLYRQRGPHDTAVLFCKKAHDAFQELGTLLPANRDYEVALDYYKIKLDDLQTH